MAHSTNYATLVADIKAYCDHTETEFNNQIDAILARGQDRLQRALDLEFFRTFEAKTLTAAANTIDISGDNWLVISGAYLTSTAEPIEPRDIMYCRQYNAGGTGTPRYYALQTEGTIYLAPSPTSNTGITFEVQARQAVLDGDNTTNWFTKHAADALLYVCLAEAEMFLVAPERKAEFEQMYVAAVQQLRNEFRGSGNRRSQYADAYGVPPVAGAPA